VQGQRTALDLRPAVQRRELGRLRHHHLSCRPHQAGAGFAAAELAPNKPIEHSAAIFSVSMAEESPLSAAALVEAVRYVASQACPGAARRAAPRTYPAPTQGVGCEATAQAVGQRPRMQLSLDFFMVLVADGGAPSGGIAATWAGVAGSAVPRRSLQRTLGGPAAGRVRGRASACFVACLHPDDGFELIAVCFALRSCCYGGLFELGR
jgi:hypothetical protein